MPNVAMQKPNHCTSSRWQYGRKRSVPITLYVAESLNNLAGLYQDQGRYADALPILKRAMSHNLANKSIAFAVLYGSESRNLIPPKEVLERAIPSFSARYHRRQERQYQNLQPVSPRAPTNSRNSCARIKI